MRASAAHCSSGLRESRRQTGHLVIPNTARFECVADSMRSREGRAAVVAPTPHSANERDVRAVRRYNCAEVRGQPTIRVERWRKTFATFA